LNLKVLFIAFLLFVSLSAICNVAITVLKTPPMLSSQNEYVRLGQLILGRDEFEPDGDPRGGGPK